MEHLTLSPTSRSLRRVRWAQALVYATLALALLATAFASWRDVERVRSEVTAAQGRRILFALGRDLEWERSPTPKRLERSLRSLRDEGLRCVVVLGRDGAPAAEAGKCPRPAGVLQESLGAERPGTMLDLDGLVALASDPPPPPGPPPPRDFDGLEDWPPPMPPPPDGMSPPPPHFGGPPPHPPGPGRPGGPGRRPRLLIAFEPLEANALRQSATRSLAVALVTVLALLVATIVLWRLARRAESLQMAAERDRTLVTLGEMSAVLAHEIRNPLAALKGHAQLLVERLEAPGAEHQKAERLVHEVRRLERLVNDLLSFVRASRITRAAAEPAAVLREAVDAVGPERIDVETGTAPATWQLDVPRMQLALANVLRNALEASPDGARVRATAEADGRQLVFRVRDHGPGLPPGDPERLFDAFHTTRVQGTGLGLSVARRIAELHGGRVTARTHPAGGAEFCIVIP
jgi:two-component system, NtrC family, sensor histidine kinase HydH